MEILWVLIGGAVLVASFKAGQEFEREAAKRRRKKEKQEESDLGLIGPIAVLWAAGRLSDEQANREVRRCCITRDSPLVMWRSMSKGEKLDLAERMARLSKDPEWQAQQEKSRHATEKLMTELGWAQLEPTPTGGQA